MASRILFANNAASTLLNNVGPTDVTLVLPGGDGAMFPADVAGASFYVTVEDVDGNIEIMQCTHRASDVLTVVRGREGTAARSFTSGAVVECRVTAGILSYVDFVLNGDLPGGPPILDVDGHILIDQMQAPMKTYGDTVWNVKLNYTPVQQGTGIGQLPNVVKIGWKAGSKLGATVDATDIGNLATETWANATFKPIGYAPTWPISGTPATFPPSAHSHAQGDVTGLTSALGAKLSTSGGTITGNLTVTGALSGGSVTDTSDSRIKRNVKPMTVEDALAIINGTQAVRFFNISTNRDDFGVIADKQLAVTPELVFEDAATMKSVAYQRLVAPLTVALQFALGQNAALSARIEALEAKLP
jgi:hypothetical protein